MLQTTWTVGLRFNAGLAIVVLCLRAAMVSADPIEPFDVTEHPVDAANTTATPIKPTADESDLSSNLWANDPRLKGEKFDAARKALAENRVAESLRILSEAGDADSTLPPPEVMLAYLYLAAGRWNEGIKALDAASIVHRSYPEVYYAAGQIALGQGRNLEAWVLFDRAMRMKPPEIWPAQSKAGFALLCLAGLAHVAERRGDWKSAEAIFADWAKADSQDARVFDRWGTALFMLAKPEQAYEKFRRSHQLDEQMNPAELSIAALWATQSDSTRAEEWYKKAIAAYPNDYRTYREYGGGLLLAAKYAEASTQLERAAEMAKESSEGENLELLLLRGYAARALKNYPEAEARFTEVLKLSPGYFEALRQLPLVLVEQNEEKREEALQFANLLVGHYPRTPAARATLGWVQYKLGQKREGEESLKAASIDPNIETLYFLGQVLMDAGKTAEAKEVVAALQPQLERPTLAPVRNDARRWLERISLLLN